MIGVALLPVKVLVVIVRPGDGALLVSSEPGPDGFERPLGGGIELGESSVDAARRELREELDVELEDLDLLGVLENRYELAGEAGHEIVFVYSARLADPAGYDWDERRILDHPAGSPTRVRWRERHDTALPLVPAGLGALLPSLP